MIRRLFYIQQGRKLKLVTWYHCTKYIKDYVQKQCPTSKSFLVTLDYNKEAYTLNFSYRQYVIYMLMIACSGMALVLA